MSDERAAKRGRIVTQEAADAIDTHVGGREARERGRVVGIVTLAREHRRHARAPDVLDRLEENLDRILYDDEDEDEDDEEDEDDSD